MILVSNNISRTLYNVTCVFNFQAVSSNPIKKDIFMDLYKICFNAIKIYVTLI